VTLPALQSPPSTLQGVPGRYTIAVHAGRLQRAGVRALHARSRSERAGAGRTCWRMRASSSPAAKARRSPARRSARTWRAPGSCHQLNLIPAVGRAAQFPRASACARACRARHAASVPRGCQREAGLAGREPRHKECASAWQGCPCRSFSTGTPNRGRPARHACTSSNKPARHAFTSSAEPAPGAEAWRRRRAERRRTLSQLAEAARLGVGQRQAVVEVAHPHDVLMLEQAAREAPLAGAPRRARHLRARHARAREPCPAVSARGTARSNLGPRISQAPGVLAD